MLRTLIVLQDGTEIFSGSGDNAVQSVTYKQQVNSAKLLTLGSVCASMLEVKFQTRGGSLNIAEGDEITAYRVSDNGEREMLGVFSTQKPTRLSQNAIKVTAYDRVTKLDRDLTEWLAGLNRWPYTLSNFANMVCNACGLTLITSSIPNGSYQVQKFSAMGITGRKLMQWVGEAAGRFCRATPEGNIEFAWYEPSGVSISPSGSNFYYQNGLTYEDYEVAPVEKVQIKLTQDDVGVVWPNVTGERNTYVISGNYLLTTTSEANLQPVAQTLYNILKDATYTPCRVKIPTGMQIQAGNTVQISDRNGKTFTAYVMTRTISGQRETLESTGSHRRDSTTVVNNQSYEAIAGKLLEVKQSVDGFSITATEIKSSAVVGTVDEFYQSISPSYLAGGSWSEEQPEWIDGMYIWIRAKVTKGDGTVTYTPSENGVCISGNTGTAGENAITCYIESSTGYTFKIGETASMTARLFDGTTEIDPTGELDYTWYRRIDGSSYQAFANGKTIYVSDSVFDQNMDIYFVCGVEEQVNDRAVVGVAVAGVAIVGKG